MLRNPLPFEAPVLVERQTPLVPNFESTRRKRGFEETAPTQYDNPVPEHKKRTLISDSFANELMFPPVRVSLPLRKEKFYADSGCYGWCQPIEAQLFTSSR